jgi:hypothetical protein
VTVVVGEDESGPLSKVQRTAADKLTALVGKVVDDGVGPIQGSRMYAGDRLERAQREGRSQAEAVEAGIKMIIRESVAAAGTTGFVTGLGGLLALPITLPTNVAGNLAINARMVGAIAHLRGYTLDDPHTPTSDNAAPLAAVTARRGSSARPAISAASTARRLTLAWASSSAAAFQRWRRVDPAGPRVASTTWDRPDHRRDQPGQHRQGLRRAVLPAGVPRRRDRTALQRRQGTLQPARQPVRHRHDEHRGPLDRPARRRDVSAAAQDVHEDDVHGGHQGRVNLGGSGVRGGLAVAVVPAVSPRLR